MLHFMQCQQQLPLNYIIAFSKTFSFSELVNFMSVGFEEEKRYWGRGLKNIKTYISLMYIATNGHPKVMLPGLLSLKHKFIICKIRNILWKTRVIVTPTNV